MIIVIKCHLKKEVKLKIFLVSIVIGYDSVVYAKLLKQQPSNLKILLINIISHHEQIIRCSWVKVIL